MGIPTSSRMASYQTPDSKKEEFRKYLERSGVIDALTKVLVGLYEEPEKPANALDFIKMTLGAPTGVDVEALKARSARQLRPHNWPATAVFFCLLQAENETLRKKC